jgi:hypothetical protein
MVVMFRTIIISLFISAISFANSTSVIEGRVANISINDLAELPNGHFALQLSHEGKSIATTLQRFYVTSTETKFVLGNINQKDTPFVFDPNKVTLLRSVADDQEQTHAVIAIYKEHVRGSIKLQSGQTILLTNTDQTDAPASRSPEIQFCGIEQEKNTPTTRLLGSVNTPPNQFYRLKQAVETDYEYRNLFDSTEDAAAYVVLCFGLIHDVYLRDTNTHVELTYVRLWEDENDLFNQESPLGAFRNYWNENMQSVDRNLAQFFSGRRNLPYGGSAYISAINEDWGYSVVGYLMGFAGDINRPDVLNYDVHVAAHEIGHNCGTYHTHDYGIDDCFNLDSPPVRGPIMSYCSQSTSGGNAVTDVRFHTFVQDVMDEHMQYAHETYPADFVHDCNGNGIDDNIDISSGTSSDVNSNEIPDECEDCNQNGTLDSLDIQLGSSQDVDGNGVPDECEYDCNENNIPDTYDIAQGTSLDIWGNGIPDECESDCDGDGQSDYNQIQAQMDLDLDRDLILDSCQDCNGNGVTDLDELNGAWSTWVGSNDASGEIVAFHSIVGTRTNQTSGSAELQTWEILITDDYRILATSPAQSSVLEYDREGNFVGELVPTGSNGLLNPTGMVLTPTNTLLVSSNGSNQILEFNATNGEFIGVFAEDPLLTVLPLTIIITDDQRVLVSLDNETVSSFDLATGNSNGLFIIPLDNGGLTSPRGMAQLQNGDILIASMGTNNVLKFDGETGSYAGQFNNGGTDVALTMDEPWGVRVGPDGDVYVTRHGTYDDDGHDGLRDDDTEELHVNSTRMYIFDSENGNFIRSYITGNDTELWQPTGFDFMPGTIEDCNINGKPDACDILSGFSEDLNGDGIPDECGGCESDISGDGFVNVNDLLVVIDQWGQLNSPADLNFDGTVNVSDLLIVIDNWGPC